MNPRSSYNICARKQYFETFELKESRVAWLDDNKVSKVHGIGTVRLKMLDNFELFCT